MTNKYDDNAMCPVCKTGHHVDNPETHYIYCESCLQTCLEESAMTESFCPTCGRPDGGGHEDRCYDTDLVTFGDHGTSSRMGNYLMVCMKSTPEAYNQVHTRFFNLFGHYPKTRDKFCGGETTFYSSDRGDRGASY
jgi:hypothetical protein